MWQTLKKLIKDCLTENDGKSYCAFRVSGCALTLSGVPTFIALSIFAVLSNPEHHFDMVAFGTAFGFMMSGLALLAGGVAFKAKGELRDGEEQRAP